MRSVIFVSSYCALAIVVAFLVRRYVRGLVAGILLSPTIAAVILQIVAFLYLGRIDAWADIAFLTTWLIAFACAFVVNVLAWMWPRLRLRKDQGRS